MRMIEKLEEALLVFLFLTAFAVLFLQILSRHFFPYPLAWTEEAARFLFLWIVFLGAAYLVRLNGHIAISLATNFFPTRIRTITYVVMQAFILVFALALCWHGTDVAWKVRKLPTIALGISSAWEYTAVPISAGVIAVRTVLNLLRAAREGAPKDADGSLI